jgi:hypothetical protein
LGEVVRRSGCIQVSGVLEKASREAGFMLCRFWVSFVLLALKLFVLFRLIIVVNRAARFILGAAAAADGGMRMMLM